MADDRGSRIAKAAEAHREALRAGVREAYTEIYLAYERANAELQKDFKRFNTAWRAAAADADLRGETLDKKWLLRDADFKASMARYANSLDRIAPLVLRQTTVLAAQAARLGTEHATELIGIAEGLSRSPVSFIVAQVAEGPLAELIAGRAEANAGKVSNILVDAVTRGQSPIVTARQLRAANDGAFQNSLTVAKTEQFRAYRSAALERYDQSETVTKWRWFARLSDRTCVACWEMDGQEFDTDQEMEAHPNCACVMLPVVSGVTYRAPGAELFDGLPESRQETILGPSAFAAYKDGAVSLTDLTMRRESADWGTSVGRAPLSEAVGADKAAEYLAQARQSRTV
jgi:SPP1 gp7 family putative phage head morphogenesis protein